jgi:hypothetical protein
MVEQFKESGGFDVGRFQDDAVKIEDDGLYVS